MQSIYKTTKYSKKFRVFIYFLSLILAVFIIEIGLRMFISDAHKLYYPYFGLTEEQQNFYLWKIQPPQNSVGTITEPYSFDITDPLLGWKNLSNADVDHSKKGVWNVKIKTNSQGFRGHEYNNEKIKVAIIGASQTFGESVNNGEEFPAIINNELADVSVINLGVRGFGTDQMLLNYQNISEKIKFDIAILAFAFHHIPRNVSTFTFYAKPVFVMNEGKLILSGAPVKNSLDLYDKDIPEFRKSLLNKSLLLRILLKFTRGSISEKIYQLDSSAWRITKALIKEFSIISKKNNTRFILLNIEEKYESLENELKVFSNKQNIEYVNFGPFIREMLMRGLKVYAADQQHWTALGHRQMADELMKYIHCDKSYNECINLKLK